MRGWLGCSEDSRQGWAGHGEECGFHSTCNGKPGRVLKSQVRRVDLSPFFFRDHTPAALWRRASGKNKWNHGEGSEFYSHDPGRRGGSSGSGDEETQTSSGFLLEVELTGLSKD